MSLTRLKDFLDTRHIKYVVISHSLAYTAQGVAALTHIPGKELAKTVVVKLDGTFALAVVPASSRIDIALMKAVTQVKSAEIATEDEFKDRFPDCETGAMPPFGNLYGMSVFVDEVLSHDKEIAFNAGTHRELVRMSWEDFEKLVKPTILPLTASRIADTAA